VRKKIERRKKPQSKNVGLMSASATQVGHNQPFYVSYTRQLCVCVCVCVCVSAVGPCDVQQQSLSASSTLESTTYSAGQESSGTDGACDGQLSCRSTSSFSDVTCLPRSNVVSSTALNADSSQVKTGACLNPS